MNLPELQIKQSFGNLLPSGGGSNRTAENGDEFSGILKNILQPSENPDPGNGKGSDLRLLAGLKGKKLLAGLENLLRQNGQDLDHLTADDTALAAFKRLMVSAGFDPKQLEALLSELTANAGKKGVRVSDLFKRVSELDEKNGSEDLLEPSAFPFIESILSRLLPDAEQQRLAWQGLRAVDEGIDIARLIANLKRIQDHLPDRGRSVPEPVIQKQVAKLMKDAGLGSETGVVTLEKFVVRLEALASERDGLSAIEKGLIRTDVKRFAENLKPSGDVQNDTGEPNGADYGRVAARNGGKKAVPAAGDKAAAANAAKADAPVQGSGSAPAAAEESNTGPKPVETVAAAAGKGTDTSLQASVAEAKSPVRTLPAYVVNQVSRQIVRSFQNGTQEIRLQLHPPNLGRLQMHIDRSGEMLRVQIITEQQSTRELLMTHAGDLKTILTDHGLRLEKIDVQFDQYFEQSLADARQGSNRSNGRRPGGRTDAMAQGSSSRQEPEDDPPRRAEGILDLVA